MQLRRHPQIKSIPYLWPHDGGFSPSDTAFVIIDMQKDFCSPGGYLSLLGLDITPILHIIPNIHTLLSAARAHDFPIFHTREGHRPDLSTLSTRELARSRNNPSGLGIGDVGPLGRLLIRGEEGQDTIPELYPLPNEPVVEKPGKGCFAYTEFELMLRVRGVRKLVVCGVTTDVCVSCVVREANDRGFECLLVEDACAAAREELHNAAVEMVRGEGGVFGATAKVEDVLHALGS